MSDYLKSKRANDPVLTHIAAEYRNASLIGEKFTSFAPIKKRSIFKFNSA